jgi:hypothetical protein
VPLVIGIEALTHSCLVMRCCVCNVDRMAFTAVRSRNGKDFVTLQGSFVHPAWYVSVLVFLGSLRVSRRLRSLFACQSDWEHEPDKRGEVGEYSDGCRWFVRGQMATARVFLE